MCVDFGNGEEERKRPMGPPLGGPNILKAYWRVPFAIMVIDTVTKLEMIVDNFRIIEAFLLLLLLLDLSMLDCPVCLAMNQYFPLLYCQNFDERHRHRCIWTRNTSIL
jgi:hypothetical protein